MMQSGGYVAKLVVSAEGKPERIVEIGERLTIGRSTNNQLIIEDQKASRNHAEIRHVGGGRYRLSDVGSANGTWLNGRRLAVPKDLEDADQILIGGAILRFIAPPPVVQTNDKTMSTGTALFLRSELVVILVADIRNYTGMSETLPAAEFSRLIADWFRESSDIIEKNGGTIDKFIGDAVMAYWVASNKLEPAREVDCSLHTARQLIARSTTFSNQLASQFPGQSFRIGIGLNLGDAMLGNVGTGENQSFTIVGDSVNIAFRLESLTKEKGTPVIANKSIVDVASKTYEFSDLGQAEVKGRKELVSIWAPDFGAETKY
jgi:adenylate cyclase